MSQSNGGKLDGEREFSNQENNRRLREVAGNLRIIGDNLNNQYEQRRAEQPFAQDADVEEIVHQCFVILVQLCHLFWQRWCPFLISHEIRV